MDHLPIHTFRKCIEQHSGNRHEKYLTYFDQFLFMTIGQLSFGQSYWISKVFFESISQKAVILESEVGYLLTRARILRILMIFIFMIILLIFLFIFHVLFIRQRLQDLKYKIQSQVENPTNFIKPLNIAYENNLLIEPLKTQLKYKSVSKSLFIALCSTLNITDSKEVPLKHYAGSNSNHIIKISLIQLHEESSNKSNVIEDTNQMNLCDKLLEEQ